MVISLWMLLSPTSLVLYVDRHHSWSVYSCIIITTFSRYGLHVHVFLLAIITVSLCPEEDWQAIVGVTADMSERTRQQQTAIWELVETEVVYLKTIKVITDVSIVNHHLFPFYILLLVFFFFFPVIYEYPRCYYQSKT